MSFGSDFRYNENPMHKDRSHTLLTRNLHYEILFHFFSSLFPKCIISHMWTTSISSLYKMSSLNNLPFSVQQANNDRTFGCLPRFLRTFSSWCRSFLSCEPAASFSVLTATYVLPVPGPFRSVTSYFQTCHQASYLITYKQTHFAIALYYNSWIVRCLRAMFTVTVWRLNIN